MKTPFSTHVPTCCIIASTAMLVLPAPVGAHTACSRSSGRGAHHRALQLVERLHALERQSRVLGSSEIATRRVSFRSSFFAGGPSPAPILAETCAEPPSECAAPAAAHRPTAAGGWHRMPTLARAPRREIAAGRLPPPAGEGASAPLLRSARRASCSASGAAAAPCAAPSAVPAPTATPATPRSRASRARRPPRRRRRRPRRFVAPPGAAAASGTEAALTAARCASSAATRLKPSMSSNSPWSPRPPAVRQTPAASLP